MSQPAPSPFAAGFACRCPQCGRGSLFPGALSLTPVGRCSVCGLDLAFAEKGDGPAVFAIFILGFLVLGGALIAEFKFGMPVWGHILLWGLATPVIALFLLRILKATLVALQFRTRAGQGVAQGSAGPDP